MSSSSGLKVIVVGNGKVGKTSLAVKFTKDTFSSQYKKTLGVDYLTRRKYVQELSREVSFSIWDTAGQECYQSLTRRYYKGADAALIVFSMTDRDSFNQIGAWYERITSECESIPIILVMSKADLSKEAVITEAEARQFSVSMGFDLVLCSAKKGVMIDELFDNLAIKYFHDLYFPSKRRKETLCESYLKREHSMDFQQEYTPHKAFKLKIAQTEFSSNQYKDSNKRRCC